MFRNLISMTACMAFATLPAALANAHLIYIYVPTGSEEVHVVFGHGPYPDESASLDRVKQVSLRVRTSDGEIGKIETGKGSGNYFAGKMDTKSAIVVHGVAAVGVTQRGEQPPQLTTYHPKTILGDPFAPLATIGGEDCLEIVPVRSDAKVRFQVRWNGEPVENVSMEVLVPGAKFGGESMKSDANGMSDSFSDSGRFAVAATYIDPSPGTHQGTPYQQIRHIASLVLDVP